MNLIDFYVKEIIEEKEDVLWKLYDYTADELAEYASTNYEFYRQLISRGCKQRYRYVDMGGEGVDTAFWNLDNGQIPYKVGDKGLH